MVFDPDCRRRDGYPEARRIKVTGQTRTSFIDTSESVTSVDLNKKMDGSKVKYFFHKRDKIPGINFP